MSQPVLENSFRVGKVREIMTKTMQKVLADQTYSSSKAGQWTKDITDQISREIRDLEMEHYKHVVQVTIGQQTGAGCKYMAKALWDAVGDQQLCEQLVNGSIFCVVAVFGIYS